MVQTPRLHLTGYHAGALEAQIRAGPLAQQKAQQLTSLFITRPISEQLQAFFSDLRLLYTATRQVLHSAMKGCKLLAHCFVHVDNLASKLFSCRGQNGRLWASVLQGNPSFIQVSNPYQATIKSVKQFQGDPARYVVGTSMGTLGIMLENRRRNLLNGIISRSKDGCLHLDVYQALGNCPKYIQGDLLWQTCGHVP